MRPNILWFDESYNQTYYRSETIRDFCWDGLEAVIVVGTALETSMAASLVNNALLQDVMVIEVNPEPCLKQGNVVNVNEKSEKALPEILKGMKSVWKLSSASTKASEKN